MITITRRQARGLRGLFRRSTLGIVHRGSVPPLVLVATGDHRLCARYRHADLAVEEVITATGPSSGLVALPLDALADLEGRDDSPLSFDPVAPDRTVVRWSDRGIPQVREYPVPAIVDLGALPGLPPTWAEVPADLLDALVEATATASDDSTRYALDCLLLRSGPASHEVVATDGRQALICGGFAFPWTGDVLVHRSPIFAARDLPRDRPWSIGRTDTHVALRCESFLIALEIRTDARYPKVDMIFPAPDAATARLRIDPLDATFLLGSLGRLPGSDAPHAPVTVDLNGRIAVRASDLANSATTELVLSRSRYSGTPVRFGTDRDLLARALRLGFAEVEVIDPGSPIVCRSGRSTYAWQPLNPGSAIEPGEEVTRIESDLGPSTVASRSPEPPPRTTRPLTTTAPGKPEAAAIGAAHAVPIRPEVAHDPAATGLLALISEAESLHDALGAARTRSQKLIVALKRQRKQARLMAATLNTLRQLKLQEVAG